MLRADLPARQRATGWPASTRSPTRELHQQGDWPTRSGEGLFAIANGGWFGVGLGEGRLKWGWLPNGHNDFIFAVIAEELGVVGCLVVLGPVRACSPTPGCASPAGSSNPFRRLVAAGVTALIAGQATINIAGVVGLVPVTGLPLPLISDGGSALVVTLAMIGMLASFARAEPAAARALHARPPGRLGPATLGSAAAAAAGVTTGARRRPTGVRQARSRPDRRRGTGIGRRGGEETTMAELRSVVLAGGGTGGHIYPLLAFADCLRRHEPDLRITCVGSAKGLEGELIPAAGLRAAPGAGVPAAPLGQPGPGPHPGPDAALDAGRPGRCSTTSRPTWWSASAATSRCRPTWPPGGGTPRS